jgi:hypothetical protein
MLIVLGCALAVEMGCDCALVFGEVVARVGRGIFEWVLTIPRVLVDCLFLRRTSPAEDPTIPRRARVPIAQLSAWIVVLT